MKCMKEKHFDGTGLCISAIQAILLFRTNICWQLLLPANSWHLECNHGKRCQWLDFKHLHRIIFLMHNLSSSILSCPLQGAPWVASCGAVNAQPDLDPRVVCSTEWCADQTHFLWHGGHMAQTHHLEAGHWCLAGEWIWLLPDVIQAQHASSCFCTARSQVLMSPWYSTSLCLYTKVLIYVPINICNRFTSDFEAITSQLRNRESSLETWRTMSNRPMSSFKSSMIL